MKKLALVLTIALALASPATSATAQETAWTGSWAAAPVAAPTAASNAYPDGTTYRDIVHLSLGGDAIRLRFSNEFGTAPLTIASVRAAVSAGGATTQIGTDHVVTFGGSESVTIPAGALIVSDPVAIPVKPFTNLAVSLFVPARAAATALTYHLLAMSTNYIIAGNVTQSSHIEGSGSAVTAWYLLKGVDVDAGHTAASAVILGASISDGYHSTPDKNARWPDVLAARLQADKKTSRIGVLNEGISGNRLLHDVTGPSALSRLDRDVLAQPGAKYLIVSIGTNDIGRTYFPLPAHPNEGITTEQLIWGYQQIVSRAHARGIKVFASTLTPFGGAAYYNAAGEQIRQAVNSFARTSKVFDGVIDFDQVTRDPAHPETLLPAYDSGDHLHPNDAGYKAMGESIDLKLFAK
jgi:lysophospholipase L1-like esterase